MVVAYRNRFIKVFLAFLFFIFLVVVDLFWLSNIIRQGINVSESALVTAKWLTYALIPLLILAEILYVYSHYLLAKAKGYSGWLALLSLLNFFLGLAIIFLLPNKRKLG